jgi:hypothetical protein
MSLLTVKRLLIYTAFLFFLNGCGSALEIDGEAIGKGVSVVPKGDGTALISWAPPTENTDDSALTDLAGFKIHYGTFPGEYEETITINNPGLTSYLVEDLGASDWFFVMSAFNSSQIESAYSEEVFKTIE